MTKPRPSALLLSAGMLAMPALARDQGDQTLYAYAAYCDSCHAHRDYAGYPRTDPLKTTRAGGGAGVVNFDSRRHP